MKLNNNELKMIRAGASAWLVGAISLAVTFLIGVLDGIARPFKCR